LSPIYEIFWNENEDAKMMEAISDYTGWLNISGPKLR
jgi:hypothetical protein